MLEKIKLFLKKVKDTCISLFNKFIAWFKKNWFMIINYIVILLSYSIVYGHEEIVVAETLLGLWIFTSIAYGAYKWFIKK